jgi:hypothetical protein
MYYYILYMIVTSGQISNYNDAGYTISTSFYNQSNTLFSSGTYVNSSDIYINNPSVGVYLLNGGHNVTSTKIYPVYCTTTSVSNGLGIPNDVDNGYLVYPGYGFILYPNGSFGGTESRLYYNISSIPYIFYNTSSSSWNGQLNTCPIYNVNNNDYGADKTSSIKIFYRGAQVNSQLAPYT